MFPLYAFKREATLKTLLLLHIKISPNAMQPLDLLSQPEEWSSGDLSRPLKDNTKGPLNSLIWNYTNSTPCQLTHTQKGMGVRKMLHTFQCDTSQNWNSGTEAEIYRNQTFVCPNYQFMSLTLFSPYKGDCMLPVKYECGPCDSILVCTVTWT